VSVSFPSNLFLDPPYLHGFLTPCSSRFSWPSLFFGPVFSAPLPRPLPPVGRSISNAADVRFPHAPPVPHPPYLFPSALASFREGCRLKFLSLVFPVFFLLETGQTSFFSCCSSDCLPGPSPPLIFTTIRVVCALPSCRGHVTYALITGDGLPFPQCHPARVFFTLCPPSLVDNQKRFLLDLHLCVCPPPLPIARTSCWFLPRSFCFFPSPPVLYHCGFGFSYLCVLPPDFFSISDVFFRPIFGMAHVELRSFPFISSGRSRPGLAGVLGARQSRMYVIFALGSSPPVFTPPSLFLFSCDKPLGR